MLPFLYSRKMHSSKKDARKKLTLVNYAQTKKMLTVPAMTMQPMNVINLNPVAAVLKLPKNKHL